MMWQFVINGLVTGVLYSLMAVGFAVVYNTTHVFHIAAAGVYTAAAYCFFWVVRGLGTPLWVGVACALVFAAMLNTVCEVVVYRPFARRNASPNTVMIASIGLLAIMVNVTAMLFGNETKIIDNAIRPVLRMGTLILSQPQVLQFALGSVMLAGFTVFLRFSSFGLKIRALGNNPVLFDVFGFGAGATRIGVFAIGGAFLGAAACLSAYDVGMSPHTGMPILINALVAMIVGGTGRYAACIAGGILLGILQALVVWKFAANWQPAVTFLLLIAFLFFRPRGLFGLKKRIV